MVQYGVANEILRKLISKDDSRATQAILPLEKADDILI